MLTPSLLHRKLNVKLDASAKRCWGTLCNKLYIKKNPATSVTFPHIVVVVSTTPHYVHGVNSTTPSFTFENTPLFLLFRFRLEMRAWSGSSLWLLLVQYAQNPQNTHTLSVHHSYLHTYTQLSYPYLHSLTHSLTHSPSLLFDTKNLLHRKKQ